MPANDRHIANRVLLAGAIALITVVLLLAVGAYLANSDPDGQTFISLRFVLGIVGVAIVIGDRVYVSKNKP